MSGLLVAIRILTLTLILNPNQVSSSVTSVPGVRALVNYTKERDPLCREGLANPP